MKLNRFSALAVSFAAGLALCGCASAPPQQYVSSYYVNSGPAFTAVHGEDGRNYVYPNQQAQPVYYGNQAPVYYNNGSTAQGYPYGAQAPRYPYGYNGTTPGNAFLGTLAGAAVGNAIRPGNASAIAAGAIGGNMMANSGNPCADLNVGTVAGGAAGYAIGKNIGQGDGRKVAEVVGAFIGANMGTRSMNGCP